MPKSPQHSSASPLLEVNGLCVEFNGGGRTTHAVNGISFSISPGETLGIVGESGSGKSVTNLAVMGLLPPGVSRISSGQILFKGRDIVNLSERGYRALRGREIAMIFQDPMSGLNPVLTIGEQIGEIFVTHNKLSMRQAKADAAECLHMVGLPDPVQAVNRYPHELSGGMRQRVMIAMALALRPKLVIADEPTTALDPTVEAQILDLLRSLLEDTGSALILISHDFEVVSGLVDRIAVMYAGQVVEMGSTTQVLGSPRHPYSNDLLACLPTHFTGGDLVPIEGAPPDLTNLPNGCAYAERCARVKQECWGRPPVLSVATDAEVQSAACHFPLSMTADNEFHDRRSP